YLRRVYEAQVPFDYGLGLDDSALYCVEMTEKAIRAAGLPLSEPVRVGDMEHAYEKITAIVVLQYMSRWYVEEPISLERPVFLPGNERQGIGSAPKLRTSSPPVGSSSVADWVQNGQKVLQKQE